MDHDVTSLECLMKLDSQSEVLDKDGGRKDLFSPVMVPSNCNTPIIDNKVEEPKTTILDEDLETYFSLHWGPPSPTRTGSKDEEPKIEELMDEELETEELMDEIGECKYCLKVGKHYTVLCPYRYHLPKNATLGRGVEVTCKICGCLFRGSCCASCGLSEGQAILKDCSICGKQGEHWPSTCPSREGRHIPSAFTCDDYTGYFSVNICP
ncbi:PREDICTED: uncharacterized protein LOC103343943 [Prunus mume]|uniref:Uncharacterized protein LOC103343943 n=1 Tax=Prunus mume TaxID=102107 RepID=A0ABM0PWT5_PRUMU|nr:PREDICTED: uncharacterized protein LOC103343943 [Prunus mume]